MATSSAVVETLTAEVRVLMVGNRQVTLSVYRQLDLVELEEMEPFGRVNDGRDESFEFVQVVGSHRATGALVRARAYKLVSEVVPLSTYRLGGGFVTVCSGGASNYHYRGRAVRFEPNCVKTCGIEGHDWRAKERCSGWETNGHDAQIEAAIERHDSFREQHMAAAKLPLIVLAGLR